MIKLPNEMVIYPQSEHNLAYLLCWVTPQDYAELAASPQALQELQRFHPDGVEIPLTQEALEEYGLQLPVSLEALKRAYQGLMESGSLGERRMVKGDALIEIARHTEHEEVAPEALAAPERFEALDPKLQNAIEQIDKPPRMKRGQDAADVFQRMSAQGERKSARKKGGA
jgi:hypothetical protein